MTETEFKNALIIEKSKRFMVQNVARGLRSIQGLFKLNKNTKTINVPLTLKLKNEGSLETRQKE